MLRDQEDNLRAKLEDRANPLLRSSVWVQKTTGDWARIAGQIQEIERELRGKNSF